VATLSSRALKRPLPRRAGARRLLHPHAVVAVMGAFFVALALTVLFFGTPPADTAIRDALLSLASPGVLAFIRVINHAGDKWFLVPGSLLLFAVFARARRTWWIWAGLMVMAPLLEGLLKEVIGRSRPEHTSLGFPSGHATAAAAFFGATIYLAGALPPLARGVVRALALVVILLVAVARVVLRAHWPSDALAGVALGLGLAAAAAILADRMDARAARR
jgi:membrane-associated phospholipid phosphatase